MRTLTPGEQCQRLAVRLREPGCGRPAPRRHLEHHSMSRRIFHRARPLARTDVTRQPRRSAAPRACSWRWT